MTLCVDPFKKFVSEKLKHFTILSEFKNECSVSTLTETRDSKLWATV